jgi:hypothetical protein
MTQVVDFKMVFSCVRIEWVGYKLSKNLFVRQLFESNFYFKKTFINQL